MDHRTDELLTLDEVCRLGKITKSGFRSLRQQGRVPAHYKIGRRNFFDPAEVDAWLATRIQRIEPTA